MWTNVANPVSVITQQIISNGNFSPTDADWSVGTGWTNGYARESFIFSTLTGIVKSDGLVLSNNGSSYSVNDVLTLTGGNSDCLIKVLTASGGHIQTYSVIQNGTNYTAPGDGSATATTGGTGAGATFTITDLYTESLSQPITLQTGSNYVLSFNYALIGANQNVPKIVIKMGATESTASTIDTVSGNGTGQIYSLTFTALSSYQNIYFYGDIIVDTQFGIPPGPGPFTGYLTGVDMQITPAPSPSGPNWTLLNKPQLGFTLYAGMATGLLCPPTYAVTMKKGNNYTIVNKPSTGSWTNIPKPS